MLAATGYGMMAQRHMHEFGTTSAQLARFAVVCREHALLHPNAHMKTPITVEDVLNSRMIRSPFHLLDICLIDDGGCAAIVSSAEAARRVTEQPAYILGYGEYHLRGYLTTAAGNAVVSGQTVAGPKALEMAVEYAKVRVAFGRVIGSFQAVKHKCAELVVDIELARSAVLHPCSCVDASDTSVPALASMLKAMCSEVFLKASMENIQIHGGIGYTWEHPAHLYLKRAKADYLQPGDPIYHRKRLACALGI